MQQTIGEKVLERIEKSAEYKYRAESSKTWVEGLAEKIGAYTTGALPPELAPLFSAGAAAASGTPIAPGSDAECQQLLEALDLKKAASPHFFERLGSKMLETGPAKHREAKQLFMKALAARFVSDLKTDKKLNESLFKLLLVAVRKDTLLFLRFFLLPIMEMEGVEGICSKHHLVIARCIMKSPFKAEYAAECIKEVMDRGDSPFICTVLTAILVKKIKLPDSTIRSVGEYLVSRLEGRGSYLLWDKLVLVFCRGYKDMAAKDSLCAFYSKYNKSISKPILCELEEAR